MYASHIFHWKSNIEHVMQVDTQHIDWSLLNPGEVRSRPRTPPKSDARETNLAPFKYVNQTGMDFPTHDLILSSI